MNLLDSDLDAQWQRLFAPVEQKLNKFITSHQENSQDSLKLIYQWSLVQTMPVRARSAAELDSCIRRHLELPASFPNNEDIQWAHLARKMVMFHNYVSEHLINRSFVVSEGFFYWNAVLGSRTLLVSHGLSVFPWRCYHYVTAHMSINRFPTFLMSYSIRLKREVNWKRSQCADDRKKIAALVGFLFQEKPFSDCNNIHQLSMKNIRKSVSRQLRVLSRCVETMSKLSDAVDNDIDNDEQRSPFQSQEMVAGIDFAEIENEISVTDLTLTQAHNSCISLLEQFNNASAVMESKFQPVGKPSKLMRSWPKFAFFGCLTWYALSSINRNRESLIASAGDILVTGRKFLADWILEPFGNIWKTIRHENTLQLTAGTQGLKADLESLQRMVADYARDTQTFNDNELALLTQKVSDGDLTLILKDYENDIKQPIKSVFAGQMLRILLIQVQKTKVDLELAMTGIDQMLKSQELNFAFLAIAPTLIVSGALINYMNSIYFRPDRSLSNKIKLALRNIEKLLILESECGKVSYTVNGMVIIEAYYILKQIQINHSPQEISDDRSVTTEVLRSDLEDLVNEKFTTNMKYMVVQRIMRSLR